MHPALGMLRFLALLVLAATLAADARAARADEPAQLSPPAAAPAASAAPAATPPTAEQTAQAFREQVQPLLAKYCTDCHSGEEPEGKLQMAALAERLTVHADRPQWEKILRRVRAKEMPPEDADQPEPAQREQIAAWVEAELVRDEAAHARDPGRVTLRRLNRNEYNNTIRDLLGVDFRPADDFPSDDVGYGFDHIGDVLSLPPILLEKYLTAAESVVTRTLGTDLTNHVQNELEGGQKVDSGDVVLASQGIINTKVRTQGQGHYILRVRAYGDQAGDEPVRMALMVDGHTVRIFAVRADKDRPEIYEAWLTTRGGHHTLGIEFQNDLYEPEKPAPHDRNLYVRSVELMGPYPETYKRVVPREHTPEDRLLLAREIVNAVMARAFRRPSTAAEVDRVLELVKLADAEGESFANAIGLGLQAMLVSPHFLFRVEQDPAPDDTDGIRELSDYELATRLSYFLWSSMPDDELFDLARRSKLREGDTLVQQARRMLADPKSQALVENFAGQWLQLRNLKTSAPDHGVYPGFDDALRDAMRQETEQFFAAIMREDRSVLEFLDADFTFVNERLAQHYGLADVKGKEFRRVTLDPARRGGVLGHASVLTVTSNPTRTSPVKRGKWVLENLLGTPPPPPPDEVPPLAETAEAALTGSLRQRMEQHRTNAVCASCHKAMDPLGFGLENYDGVGAWRDKDGSFDIDASGELPNGEKFSGPQELKQILKGRQQDFLRCLAEKMLTYGLGRGVEYSDKRTVSDIAQAVSANEFKFSSLIVAVVRSDAFQKRARTGSNP
ncbi:MAG: DUF1592 domain-containing protein [Pirellulales bacterium]